MSIRPSLSHTFFLFLFCLCCLSQFSCIQAAPVQQSAPATINAIRYNTDAKKTRIVFDFGQEVDYRVFALSQPNRIVIDIKGATLNTKTKRDYQFDKAYLQKMRLGQFDPNTVRVVLVSNALRSQYDVFSLPGKNSYRLVIDFYNNQIPSPSVTVPKITPKPSLPITPPVKPNITSPTPSPSKSEAANSNPLAGKIIAIDPGHGGNDSGALGPNNGEEKLATLGISLKLRTMLEKAGAKVIMTRTTDTSVASPDATDVEELQARCDIADKAHADIFISIHNDSFIDEDADGTSTYYYVDGSNQSKALANDIRETLVATINRPDRGTRSCNFYVLKHTNMPATLVEAAFISNPIEEKLLMSPDGQEQVAKGIFLGIKKYFSQN